jgi:hypothetical protein
MMQDATRPPVDSGRMFIGGALVLAGGVLLAHQAGWLTVPLGLLWWRLWPLAIVGIGLQHLVAAKRERDGLWLVAIGLILLLCTCEVLRWREAWPLYIVAAGAQIIWREWSRPKEDRHDH